MKAIVPILLFLGCCAISLFCWYVAANISLATAGWIMGSGGRSLTTGESVIFFALAAFPVFLFPLVAWLFRGPLGQGAVPFGFSPIILPVLFFGMISFLRNLDRKSNEHSADGVFETVYHSEHDGDLKMSVTYKDSKMNGEMVRYCPDGTPLYQGTFLADRKVGEHKEKENCASAETKITTYGDNEAVLDIKKFSGGQMTYHYYSDRSPTGEQLSYQLSYKYNAEKKGMYRSQQITIAKDRSRQIQKNYDENGKLISEIRLP